ncbi:hypothetical protein Sango_2911100 [Sesamum angolense]|uniref:Uncharacterized protein n=1 Tax=Sesamum angolense TaxID=2727404 RepID=A0AAE1T4D9_9LAMI|nr:hypothetical protein Sango_2911100 [Sesamum angolense]
MVVYQPPVLELPVPIKAYRSVNRFANNKNLRSSRRLTNRLGHQTARAGPFCLALNGMALLVTLRPDPSPHVRLSPPETQEVGFANTTLGPSPSFYYADPGPGRLFGKPVPTALTARLACQR